MSAPSTPSRKPAASTARALVHGLSHEGRGIARVDNKAVFIDGALPGDTVEFRYTRRKRHFDEGVAEHIIEPAPGRVTPACRHFGVCGGCCLQHLDAGGQLRLKEAQLLEDLARIGGVRPEGVLAPVSAAHWGYRRRARLGVRYVIKKGRLLVGFRERQGRYLADLERCEVLHPAVGLRLQALRLLLQGLHGYEHIPQIEVASGDAQAALVVRHLRPLDAHDLEALTRFGRWYSLYIYLQPGGVETVHPLWPQAPRLSYRLPAHEVEIEFLPTDFVQVNGAVNRQLVDRVMDLLAPEPGERALDLFCGVGNFTLPMARRFGGVTGVEGEPGLVERAAANAGRNGITNADFQLWDLSRDVRDQHWWPGSVDKVLLDPPRTGAREVLEAVTALGPRRIVYVSCNPATLARDAAELAGHGYRLERAGAVDMFPHTAHVEAVAVFEAVSPARNRR